MDWLEALETLNAKTWKRPHRAIFIQKMILASVQPSPEIQRDFLKISKNGEIKTSREYERLQLAKKSFTWYTNGEFNIKIRKGDAVPKNFSKGYVRMSPQRATKKRINSKNERGKKIVDLQTGSIYHNMTDASDQTGLSIYNVSKSLKKRVPVNGYYFSFYKKGTDFEVLKKEYDLNTIMPYRQIREKISGKVYLNEADAEKNTGMSRYFIRKSIRQNVPFQGKHFEIVDERLTNKS